MQSSPANAGFLCIKMDFKLLNGGQSPDSYSRYKYAGGCVTNTRLMGVLGLHLHWEISFENSEGPVNIHQFYYFDIEEIGLDSLKIISSDNEEEVLTAEKASFGGLGAKMIPVSEREARYLAREFVRITKEKKQPLPEEASLVDFVISDDPQLCEEEIRALNKKMCDGIRTDYGLVNYYLMRCFGKDPEGAALLVHPDSRPEDFGDVSLEEHATFLQNNIEGFTDENGRFSYLCESFLETDSGYRIAVSELVIKDGAVASAKRRSLMNISVPEASLLLNRPEFVSVFEIITHMDTFDEDFDQYTVGCTKTGHETGDMYMEFKPDNSHVESRNFRLADDIRGLYYVTDYGQLIVGAYSLSDILEIDSELLKGSVSGDICITARYQFAQSIIYEFALSGFTDFSEFLDNIML